MKGSAGSPQAGSERYKKEGKANSYVYILMNIIMCVLLYRLNLKEGRKQMKNLLMKLNTTSRMVYFFRFLLYVITCMFCMFSSGLRCVKPYYFTFTSHAKGRWVWFNVHDVFCKEFQAESPE